MTVATGTRRVVVFACGDPGRGDDSIAGRAVACLPAQTLALADVRIVGALEPEYLVDLPAGTAVVIVDAVVGVPPGRIVELDLADLGARAERVMAASTHQLPLDKAVALAQLMRDEPLEGRFVGVGIESVSPAEELAEPVLVALPALRAVIADAVRSLATSRSGARLPPGETTSHTFTR